MGCSHRHRSGATIQVHDNLVVLLLSMTCTPGVIQEMSTEFEFFVHSQERVDPVNGVDKGIVQVLVHDFPESLVSQSRVSCVCVKDCQIFVADAGALLECTQLGLSHAFEIRISKGSLELLQEICLGEFSISNVLHILTSPSKVQHGLQSCATG